MDQIVLLLGTDLCPDMMVRMKSTHKYQTQAAAAIDCITARGNTLSEHGTGGIEVAVLWLGSVLVRLGRLTYLFAIWVC